MPIFEFEYFDDSGERHTFSDLFPSDYDMGSVKSPCGNYSASKIQSNFKSDSGLTRAEKKAGTTKKRVEMTNFMKEQKRIRQQAYAPGTRQHDSNEIWTGTEGNDGITEIPIKNKDKGE